MGVAGRGRAGGHVRADRPGAGQVGPRLRQLLAQFVDRLLVAGLFGLDTRWAELACRGLCERHGARIVQMDQAFNFSRMVNLGVAATSAEVVLLLNNDIEITAPGLLEQAMTHAMRPEIGVVGSRLLYRRLGPRRTLIAGLLVVGAEYSLETGVVDFFDGLPEIDS